MTPEEIRKLAGIDKEEMFGAMKENISHAGTEKAQYQRKHNIKPGTPEWFKLWFSLPKLTGENPMPRAKK